MHTYFYILLAAAITLFMLGILFNKIFQHLKKIKIKPHFKKVIQLTIEFLLVKSKKIVTWLNSKKQNLRENYFEDLSPTINLNDDGTYSNAIKWALENENINNIALTGPYGSGKSSILKKFQNDYKSYKYLNISLASFNEKLEKQEGNNPEPDIASNQLIELSILQQIFYKEKQSKLLHSRFKRIRNLKLSQLILLTLFWFLWLVSIIKLFKSNYLKSFSIWSNKPDLITATIKYSVLIIAVIGVVYLISLLIGILYNLKLTKINLKDGEFDLSKDDSSILNKHLDEILYFFEATKFNVVIIEDLDRFKEPEIFTKLRELNLLINSSKQISRHIVFIYAVKDDMFKDKSRTKFFDFIIPVIPVINTSNSVEKFLEKVEIINKHTADSNKLSEEFINDISLFIDDMRLLKNICNEFLIYKDKLNSIDLKYNSLMATIVYKNFYPDDFENLHINKGMVYDVFTNKNHAVELQINEIDKKINAISVKIKEIENISITDVKELRTIYIEMFLEKYPKAIAIRLEGNEYSFSQVKDDEIFKIFQKSDNIEYSYNDTYNRVMAASGPGFNEIEKSVNPNKSYAVRESYIKLKNDNGINELKLGLEKLQEEKRETKFWSLKKMIEESVEFPPQYDKIRKEKLLWYLLQEGYIDENYYDYISFFYEGGLSKIDKKFILSNKHREPLEFNLELNKIENIIKNLKPDDYKREAILNFSLLNFLAKNIRKYSSEYELVIIPFNIIKSIGMY